ncbi:serine acetyltransferase [Mucilaginibacter sp. 44-25]|uniref:serine acetyltransferase n=1 Tax=Mucilaginibacter sp. 44-25 TaxID=1895794 RepID=UPI000969F164|nr:serine acetyltransferase [Mucilaginibacter sp. 44-25]OJW15747.1 MAG: serine acetyltransferase [Mucilaginibacter sp. 44-25]
MSFFGYIFQDWKANRGNVKGRLVMPMFRLVNAINRYTFTKIIFFPYLMFYRFFVEWHLGVELPRKLIIGRNFIFYHGQGLVVNNKAVIGDNCILRNGVSIGNKKLADGSYSRCPRLGNNVDVGANACIIGDITIGNNVSIGAGAVVVKSLPDNCIAVGNPARILENKKVAQALTDDI